jgi:uncharacterized protein DUF6719
MIKTIALISGFLVASVASSAFATTVKQEPPMGAMREGQVLLVDDGSCPAGQIKRVVGGNHTKVGGTKQIVRTSSCIPR